MQKFLYTIIKQLDLKSVEWNLIAEATGITNGHAARMRYSRFKKQMEGHVVVHRKKTPGLSRVSKSRTKVKTLKEESDKDVSNIKLEQDNKSVPTDSYQPNLSRTASVDPLQMHRSSARHMPLKSHINSGSAVKDEPIFEPMEPHFTLHQDLGALSSSITSHAPLPKLPPQSTMDRPFRLHTQSPQMSTESSLDPRTAFGNNSMNDFEMDLASFDSYQSNIHNPMMQPMMDFNNFSPLTVRPPLQPSHYMPAPPRFHHGHNTDTQNRNPGLDKRDCEWNNPYMP